MRRIRPGTVRSATRHRNSHHSSAPITGTIKSLEIPHGTGSIAPTGGNVFTLDTGFERTAVERDGFDALKVGDHVHFAAEPDPTRPGFAQASVVERDTAD